MSALRIYAVKNEETAETHMVKAANQAQGLRHIARRSFNVRVASAVEVADHMTMGGIVEDATREPTDLVEESAS